MNTLMKTGKRVIRGVNKCAPQIFTGLAIAGEAAAITAAVGATPYALDDIREAKERKVQETGDPDARLTKREVVEACGKRYIPAGLGFLLSSGMMLLSTHISLKRNAALATCVVAGQSALQEYQNKVIEKFGQEKEGEVRDDIAADRLKNNPSQQAKIIATGRGDHLCYDVYSGRYFYSDIEELRKAANDFNQRLIGDLYLSLNEWYWRIGLDSIGPGEDLGFNPNKGLLELRFGSQLADNGEPCVTVDFTPNGGPIFGYSV